MNNATSNFVSDTNRITKETCSGKTANPFTAITRISELVETTRRTSRDSRTTGC